MNFVEFLNLKCRNVFKRKVIFVGYDFIEWYMVLKIIYIYVFI